MLLTALMQGGLSSARLMMAVVPIGILLAILDLTGISLRFATAINVISDANLFIALLVTAGACLMLGMGMPTFPAYLIIVLVLGPGIKQLGIPDVAVHMFVFYFGVLSAVTPPVAIAAFAAAPISGASPMGTAAMAVGLALSGFLIPFVFVYNQSLLLILGFEWGELAWVILRLSLAVYLVATAIAGFENLRLAMWSRVLRLVAVALILTVMLPYQLGGIALAVVLMLLARRPGVRAVAA
ncbi:MAG: TRAP transporter large permease subunit [Burkholderiaceae bacterium]